MSGLESGKIGIWETGAGYGRKGVEGLQSCTRGSHPASKAEGDRGSHPGGSLDRTQWRSGL